MCGSTEIDCHSPEGLATSLITVISGDPSLSSATITVRVHVVDKTLDALIWIYFLLNREVISLYFAISRNEIMRRIDVYLPFFHVISMVNFFTNLHFLNIKRILLLHKWMVLFHNITIWIFQKTLLAVG